MFRGLSITKHCNAQNNQLFTAPRLTKLEHGSVSWPKDSRNTVMLKKFQSFMESAPGPAKDARIFEFLEFFEHYSVS